MDSQVLQTPRTTDKSNVADITENQYHVSWNDIFMFSCTNWTYHLQEINCFQTLTTSKSNIICMTTYHWNCQGLSKLVWVWWDIQYMVEIYWAYSSLHVPDQLNNMTHLSFSSKDRRFNKKNTFAFLLLLKCVQNGTPQKANSHDIWAESAAMPCKSWTLVVQSLS